MALEKAEIKFDPALVKDLIKKIKQHPDVKRQISPDIVGSNEQQDIKIQNIPTICDRKEVAHKLHAMDTVILADTWTVCEQ